MDTPTAASIIEAFASYVMPDGLRQYHYYLVCAVDRFYQELPHFEYYPQMLAGWARVEAVGSPDYDLGGEG